MVSNIDLNTTTHTFCSNLLQDIQQISYIGKQLYNTTCLKYGFDFALKQPFGHLLNDLDPKTTDSLPYCSNIALSWPTIFYLPSSKAVITHLTNEREGDVYDEANARDTGKHAKRFFKKSSNQNYKISLWMLPQGYKWKHAQRQKFTWKLRIFKEL